MILQPGHTEPTEIIRDTELIIPDTTTVQQINAIKPSEGVHYVKYKKWWNTKSINQVGRGWKEDGFYCPFPEDSKAYDEFWDEQESYIMNGFPHDGDIVPGLEYLYVNYCPIWNKKEKRFQFPDFRPNDAEWFDEIEKAMAIGPYKNAPWKDSRPSLHVTSKTRQSGHSLKGVVPTLYNMHWVPGSRNFIGAYQKIQAQKTNRFYQHYHNHLYMHTAWGKRWLRKETDEYYITGYTKKVKGQEVDAGFLSQLTIVGFADGFPEKAVGGGVDLFTFEEIGIFPGWISAITFIQNSVKDGDITTGTMLGFGAAGSLDKAKDLHEVSYDPEAYDAWAYDNKWADPSNPLAKKKVVYFVPNYSCRVPHMDEDGNPKQEAAIEAKKKALAKLKVTNYTKYLEKNSQEPNTLEEMFQVRQKPRFDAEVLDPHIAFLEAHKGEFSEFVELTANYDDMLPGSRPNIKARYTDRRPLWDSPLDLSKLSDEEREGCVEIFERPDAYPPHGLYIASIDSYNQEDTVVEKDASFGCLVIYKKQTSLSGEALGRIPVLEYVGRPRDKKKFYRTCAYALLMYNAVALPENEDQELVPWFYNQNLEHLLADQPDIIRSIMPNSNVKRNKGIHAAWPLIKAAENKIDRYLTEIIGHKYNEEGKIVGVKHGVTRILSLGMCRELRRYVSSEKDDKDFNFDRERTFGWVLMYEEETFLEKPENQQEQSEFAGFLSNTQRLGHADQGGLPGNNSNGSGLSWEGRRW